jgi:hypothetical protein
MSGLHLCFRRAHEEHLHAFELGQEIRERTGGSSLIQFSNQGDAKAVERPLPVNRIEIEQRLCWMLAAVALARINDGHGRDLGRAAGSAFFVMADDVGVAADDADRVFDLFSFHFRRESTRVLGG